MGLTHAEKARRDADRAERGIDAITRALYESLALYMTDADQREGIRLSRDLKAIVRRATLAIPH